MMLELLLLLDSSIINYVEICVFEQISQCWNILPLQNLKIFFKLANYIYISYAKAILHDEIYFRKYLINFVFL